MAQLGTHLGDADTQTGEVFYGNASAHSKRYLAYAAVRGGSASCRLVFIFLRRPTEQLIHGGRAFLREMRRLIITSLPTAELVFEYYDGEKGGKKGIRIKRGRRTAWVQSVFFLQQWKINNKKEDMKKKRKKSEPDAAAPTQVADMLGHRRAWQAVDSPCSLSAHRTSPHSVSTPRGPAAVISGPPTMDQCSADSVRVNVYHLNPPLTR